MSSPANWVDATQQQQQHSYEQILLLGELIRTKQLIEVQRFKNNYFGIFLN